MSSQTILVTGGTGYIGSHIVFQLLEKGYKVKGTTRNASKLLSIFPSFTDDRLEIIEVSSHAIDHTEWLKGVDALIHCGSPTFFRGESVHDLIEGAYHATLNLVNAAIKVGVKKVVVTSTLVTLLKIDLSDGYGASHIGPEDWCSVRFEEIERFPEDPLYNYQVAKTGAERRLWEIADDNPEIDLTTIIPVLCWGPFVPNFERSLSDSPASLSSVSFLRNLVDGNGSGRKAKLPDSEMGHLVDVRDVARAHVLALACPALPNREHKRLILHHRNFKWDEVVKVLKERYSEDEKVQQRLPEGEVGGNQLDAQLDTSLVAKAIGLDHFIPFEDTVVTTYQALTSWENRFLSTDI